MKVNELQIKQNFNSMRPDKVGKTKPNQGQPAKSEKSGKASRPFNEVLNSKLSENSSLKFSSHAAKRIQQRQMDISPAQMTRLENGVGKAAEKGAKNSLVMVDNDAYIVSVKNKTVITAIPQSNTTGNVFTNIDSVTIT